MPNDDINYASVKIKCVLVSRKKQNKNENAHKICHWLTIWFHLQPVFFAACPPATLAPFHSRMCQSALSHWMVFLDIIHSAQILLPPVFPLLTSIHPSGFSLCRPHLLNQGSLLWLPGKGSSLPAEYSKVPYNLYKNTQHTLMLIVL